MKNWFRWLLNPVRRIELPVWCVLGVCAAISFAMIHAQGTNVAGNPGTNTTGASSGGGTVANKTVVLNAGANQIPATPLGGTTYTLSDTSAIYTQSAAVAISNNGVRIWCTSPNVVIQFTGATDGFDITGMDDWIDGCTLDHNSQTGSGTGPLVSIVGATRPVVQNNFFQNVGNTNPTKAVIDANGTITGIKVKDNTCLGSCADPFIRLYPQNSAIISDYLVSGNSAFNWSFTASTSYFIEIRDGVSDIIKHGSVLLNWAYISGANAIGMAQNTKIQASGEGLDDQTAWVNNKVFGAAIFQGCFKWFGIHHFVNHGNECYNGGFAFGTGVAFGDSYNGDVAGLIVRNNPAASNTHMVSFADFGAITFHDSIIDGVVSGNDGLIAFSTAGVARDSDFHDINIAFAPGQTGTAMKLVSTTGSFNTTNNKVHDIKISGDSTASQNGFSLIDTTGTFNTTDIHDLHFSNIAGTCLSVGAGVASTFIGTNYYVNCGTPFTDAGTGTIQANTNTNCSSSASPAVCGSAAAGSVAIPTGTNATLTVNTTAVTANSSIIVQSDDTLGTKLGITCNSTLASLIVEPVVSARSAGVSFQITISGTTTTNAVCVSYYIVN